MPLAKKPAVAPAKKAVAPVKAAPGANKAAPVTKKAVAAKVAPQVTITLMRQDKLLELRELQLRRYRLPALFPPRGSSKKSGFTRFAGVGRNLRTKAAYSQIRPPSEIRNELCASE